MNNNEKLFNDWIESVVDKNIDYMLEMAGSNEYYSGWVNNDLDIRFDVNNAGLTVTETDIGYEINGSVLIGGYVQLYNSDGDETIQVKFNREVKL